MDGRVLTLIGTATIAAGFATFAGCMGGQLSSTGPLDANSDAAACTDVQSDPHNCGACGHDCLGGACQAGVCQPFTLATVPGDSSYQIVVNANDVYWSASRSEDSVAFGAVFECGIGGCNQQPTVLWQGYPVEGIALGAASLLWVQQNVPFAYPPCWSPALSAVAPARHRRSSRARMHPR
jgi:hypothetical protein